MKRYVIKTNMEYPVKRKVYNPETRKFDIIYPVEMTEVYLSMLHPKETHYDIFYNIKRSDCVFHTEEDMPYVKRVLDKLKIKHKVEEIS